MRQFSRMVPRWSQLPQRFCWFTTITRGIGTPAFGCHASTRSGSRATALRRNHATKAARPPSVHPRACGEQVDFLNIFRDESRFIPAPAGNRFIESRACSMPPVHPRACGEQAVKDNWGMVKTGSSPRLRGTVEAQRGILAGHRFIPAPAGNRIYQERGQSRESVHPRACGEQDWKNNNLLPPHGSSPRLRGTGGSPPLSRSYSRFIPAPAGNSG